jgi:chromosome segregation ATPase
MLNLVFKNEGAGVMKNSLMMVLLLASSVAFAGTDVKGSMEKLKTNEDNAKANLKQYQTNVDIASKNVKEADAAINQLREQKKKLTMSGGNLEKNRAALDQVQKRLEGYKAKEDGEMKKEDAQIVKYEELLKKLQANKDQRMKNIADYDGKIADVDRERKNWATGATEVESLKKDINDKEAKAVAERDKWVEKKKGYQAESTKWEKQARGATETRSKVERVND